jgi:hypothetical protein
MENRGRIHINLNDRNLGYRSKKLYPYNNIHVIQNHNVFTNYYPQEDLQKEQEAYRLDSPIL